jgi:hypothetical protein
MNSNDKFLLIFSLCFFMGFLFFGLVISNVSQEREKASQSVMYSSQAAAAGVAVQALAVPCYLNETFDKMLQENGMDASQTKIVAEGALDNGTHLVVRVHNDNGGFMVVTQGADVNGVSQNCRVFTGTDFQATK